MHIVLDENELKKLSSLFSQYEIFSKLSFFYFYFASFLFIFIILVWTFTTGDADIINKFIIPGIIMCVLEVFFLWKKNFTQAKLDKISIIMDDFMAEKISGEQATSLMKKIINYKIWRGHERDINKIRR